MSISKCISSSCGLLFLSYKSSVYSCHLCLTLLESVNTLPSLSCIPKFYFFLFVLVNFETFLYKKIHLSLSLMILQFCTLCIPPFSLALSVIIIISIRTKSTNTEKQLTQRYRLQLSAEKEPSAKRKKEKKTTRTVPLIGGHSDRRKWLFSDIYISCGLPLNVCFSISFIPPSYLSSH